MAYYSFFPDCWLLTAVSLVALPNVVAAQEGTQVCHTHFSAGTRHGALECAFESMAVFYGDF